MTQYMMKDMILHTRNEEQCALGRTRVRLKTYCSAPWGVLHVFLLLLMMTVGVNGAWGQADEADGFYYIVSSREYNSTDVNDCYYWVPAKEFLNNNIEQPFLTTYKTKRDANSIWRVKNTTGGIYLIHNNTGKYLILNDKVDGMAENRFRVHLERTTPNSDNKALFVLTARDAANHKYYNIKINNITDGYLNVANGNQLNYKNNGLKTLGIIGYYVTNPTSEAGSLWYIVEAPAQCSMPLIKENNGSIKITYPVSEDEGITIFYTTDGSDPSDGSNANRQEYTQGETGFSASGVSNVRACAVKDTWETSEIAELHVVMGDSHDYMIASVESDHFYMTPGAVVNNNTQVTTTNIPGNATVWHFMDAGFDEATETQYYYLCNNTSTPGSYLYLYYDSNYNLYVKSSSVFESANDDEKEYYKFKYQQAEDRKGVEFTDLPGLIILPKKDIARDLYKNSGNNHTNPIQISGNADNDGNFVHQRARWIFKPCPSTDDAKRALSAIEFATTGVEDLKYYKIQSVSQSRHITSSRADGYVSTTTSETDGQVNWYLVKVTDDTDTWLTYYYLINGETGKYMYYSGTAAGSGNAVKTLEYNSEEADKYKFVIVKTANTDTPYNIIPKLLKDVVNQANISLYTENNDNALKTANSRYNTGAQWTFVQSEDFVSPPIIRFNTSSMVEITDHTGFATAIYYTTDDSTPTTSSNPYNGAFDPADDVTTIKAISIINGRESGVATFTPPFFLGSTHNYIIQSKNCKFYNMIPNVSVDNNTKYVSALNVPCSTMAWHFEYAEEGYYYIVDANGWYLYYTTTDNSNKYIFLKSSKSDSDDGYKFRITAYDSESFNLIPKGQNQSVSKYITGNNDAGLTPARLAGSVGDVTSRWDIIPYNAANLPQWEDAPFTNVSDDSHTYYYKIYSLSHSTRPIILNNDGDVKSQELPTGIDERKTMWVIKKIADDGNDLLDFYTFENAYSGQKLYYNGNGRNYESNVLQLGLPSVTGANEQWSHFVIVQTETGYNIIPRPIVDNTKAINRVSNNEGFNCINRRAGKDILGTFYDDGNGSRWTFSLVETEVKCMNPVFTKVGENITLSCVTNASEIYFTIDGDDPTDDEVTPTKYTEQSWTSSSRHRIKAYAKLKNDETDGSNSDVITLLNKPDVTLAAGPYTYKGTAWEPSVTSVSIGETVAPTSPATYTVAYSSNNINAGTASVTITDNDDTDAWYIWNVPVTEFTIVPKAVTITANSASKYYNGTPLTESGFTSGELETGDTHTFTVVMTPGSTITNVGTQPNVISTVDGTAVTTGPETTVGNYLVTTVNGTLTVNPKAVTITANDASKDYDGTPLTESGFTPSALVEGDTHTFTVVMTPGSTITNVGTQPNVISTVDGIAVTTGAATAVGNYSVTAVNGTLTIKNKSIGDGTLAEGFTLSFDEGGEVILKYGTHTLTKNEDYTIGDEIPGTKYSSKTISGTGNYTGTLAIRNAIVHFTTDANREEWSATFVAEPIGGGDADDTKGHALPDGMKAFIITDIDGDWAIPEQLNYIPEGVPVLLVTNKETNGFIVKDASDKTPPTSTNWLVEVKTDWVDIPSRSVYLLYNNEFVLNNGGTGYTLSAGKVYLSKTAPGGGGGGGGAPSRLRIKWGEDTGIKDIQNNGTMDRKNDIWYTIDGRKLNGKPRAKGLYINGVKKIMVK